MIGNLPVKNGKVDLTLSLFQPSKEIKDFTRKVKQDIETGNEIQHRVFNEFNDVNILTRMDIDQRLFNTYVSPPSKDPDEVWQYIGRRATSRNKIISIAAHVTSTLLYPNVFAQNELDEEDKDAAEIAKELISWNIENSTYEQTFLFTIIQGLVNPCMYLGAEYNEVTQKIRTKLDNGEISTMDVIDEILSGFQTSNIAVEEMLIANPYQHYHQRQRFTARRKYIDYDELETLWGHHENWDFIKPGIRQLYDPGSEMFYDQKDEELSTLGEEVSYRNRTDDTEVVYVNGVYLGDENVENNPFKHRDNRNAPKYPEAKRGYKPIDEGRFYYYKSAAFELAPDDDILNEMWRMSLNAVKLATFMPVSVSGDEIIDGSVVFPGAVTHFNRDTKVDPILPRQDIASAFNAVQNIEQQMSETSRTDSTRLGVSAGGSNTAFEKAKEEQNARIELGLFGKMIGGLVVEFGELMIDIILHHETVAEAEEILGGMQRLKFRQFLREDTIDGKNVTKKIVFTDEFMGRNLTNEEKLQKSFGLMEEEEGKFKGEARIYKVNPNLFRKLKFKLRVEADQLLPKNETFEKALGLEAYDRMIQNPFVDQQMVTRDFLVKNFAKGDVDKYMAKQNAVQQEVSGERKGRTSALVEQVAGNGSANRMINQNVV